MIAASGTDSGKMLVRLMLMKYILVLMLPVPVQPTSTRIMKMTVMRRRNDEIKAQVIRVRVALLIWALVGPSMPGVKVRSVSSDGTLS